MAYTRPKEENSYELSKVHAIVYNGYGFRCVWESFAFSVGWILNQGFFLTIPKFCEARLLIR
jgi:hypothetical protein